MIRMFLEGAAAAGARRGALAALAVLWLAGCGDGPREAAKAPPPAPQVVVAPARVQTVPVLREYVGNVQAYSSVEISARVEGILEKRHFTEGTDVRRGQLLYTIDASQYEQSLKNAEGALANAQAGLANAQAQLANAQARERRLAPLVQEEAISRQDYDDALAQERSAQAQVAAGRAQVDSARANVESAKLSLGYTKVYATESGRIGQTLVPEGRLVGRGQPTHLVTIDRIDPIYVTFTMPDRDAIVLRRAIEKGEIRTGKGAGSVRFVLPDGSELTDAGRIDFTDAQVNRETGTITQRAIIANPQRILLPGMFVNVELKVGDRENAVVVPQRAVVKVPNGHIVYVVGPDARVERRDLVVGAWIGDDWIVEKGLAGGEQVIVDGVQRVQPGIVVAPVRQQSAPATAAPGTPPSAPAPSGRPATGAPAPAR
ncbi:MAG: efflux RND transporter periplasmic adaptor subunit [Burkholderiales bacterium]|nr:efflux RND transporter periplasmic adaptor subunit [Burkholderiales bacterium]